MLKRKRSKPRSARRPAPVLPRLAYERKILKNNLRAERQIQRLTKQLARLTIKTDDGLRVLAESLNERFFDLDAARSRGEHTKRRRASTRRDAGQAIGRPGELGDKRVPATPGFVDAREPAPDEAYERV